MSAEHGPASSEPDDFDRQLRDLTSGVAEAPRFTEPSAAERARLAAERTRARPAGQPTPMSWRNARKARKLRRPVTGQGASAQPGRLRGPAGRRAGSSRPQPRTRRQRRLRSAAKMIGILVAFAALLFVLHLLGFGPQ